MGRKLKKGKEKILYEYPKDFTFTCSECHKEYITIRPGSKRKAINNFCSEECYLIFHKKKYEMKFIEMDFRIFERDNFRCVYCGKSPLEDKIKLEIDHIYPRKEKIYNDINNLATACTICNGQKSSMIMQEINLVKIWDLIKQRNENYFKYEKHKYAIEDFFEKRYKDNRKEKSP